MLRIPMRSEALIHNFQSHSFNGLRRSANKEVRGCLKYHGFCYAASSQDSCQRIGEKTIELRRDLALYT